LVEIDDEFKNPNNKQPKMLTIKISFICHLNNAPGIAPMDIRRNIFFLKAIPIYWLPNKNPSANAIIPREEEIKNKFNALENFNRKHKSNRSYINAEKVLRLPKKPIEKNNTNV